MYTTSHALLDALAACGVTHIFANFGSDHPGLLEAIAEARAQGRAVPHVITCPQELAAMSAAHGFFQASGVAQAVFVHTDCGTQSLAGGVHNAARGRIPMLVFAGLSPFTQQGELPGSRNEFVQWIQDVHDQPGIVRGYMKYLAEIRAGAHADAIVRRALQLSYSDPQGPVYLTAAREVLEQAAPVAHADRLLPPIAPAALAPSDARAIARAIATARRPLVVTSYLGRRPDAVAALIALCHQSGIGVLESVPSSVNYPHDDVFYCGNQWNDPRPHPALTSADVVLVIDSDVPWIPAVHRPPDGATIFHLDVDPLKEQMPLWGIGATACFRADAVTAIAQIRACLDESPIDETRMAERLAHHTNEARERRRALDDRERAPEDGVPTVEHAMSCLRQIAGPGTIVLNETITNSRIVLDHLRPTRPGSMFASGGGSLGWSGGAAVGVKLARPDATIVAITGDGSFLFSDPATVHWMARRYDTPFLQIVLNNGGWRSPRLSAASVRRDGYASRGAPLDLAFDPDPDYGGIAAAAGGAAAFRVDRAADVVTTLRDALRVVRDERRAAVVTLQLARTA